MAAGELNAGLNLDLSALTFQLKAVESAQVASDQKIQALSQRATSLRAEVDQIDKLGAKLAARFKDLGKDVFRQGAGFAAANVIEQLGGGEDRPAVRVLQSAATGFAFGGFAGGVAGIAVSSVQEVLRHFQQLREEVRAERQARRDAQTEILLRLAQEGLRKENERQVQVVEERLRQRQIVKEGNELAYRITRYIRR